MYNIDKKILMVINELNGNPAFNIFSQWLKEQTRQRELDVIHTLPESVDYNFDIRFHYSRGCVAAMLALVDIIIHCDEMLAEHDKLEREHLERVAGTKGQEGY